jgi:hypothetical protein
VGNCLQQGLDVLAESIRVTTRALGENDWDWMICYNGLTKEGVKFLIDAIGGRSIELVAQSWADCPIENKLGTPRRKDGSFEWNGMRCGGTLWKVCPPRMRIDSHELVVDNDVILLRKFPQIDKWLVSESALVLEEKIRFYGRYAHLFKAGEKLNSGFMGFPPGYDFGKEIRKNWEENKSLESLTQADEQGLLTYTLNQHDNIRISKNQMVEVLARDYKTEVTGQEEGLHFTQCNRIPRHRAWTKYREFMNGKAVM